MNVNIGIDLGGTKMIALVLDEKMNILGKSKEKVKKGVTPKDCSLAMKKLTENALRKAQARYEDILHLGISIPSSVDIKTGEAFHAPALAWKNIPIKQIMAEAFNKNLVIENDVNCGIIAEHAMGAAKNFKNVVGYFVGTGLGGGIINNGQLYKGSRGLAGELGHETVKFGGRKCLCGKRGCIEAYCSKTAFAKRLKKLSSDNKIKKDLSQYFGLDFSNIKGSQLLAAWNDGNKIVMEIVKEGFQMLGVASANMVSILDPECIVYGGGVVEALGLEVMAPISEAFKRNLFGAKSSDIYLVISELGDDAVPMGAAINAIRNTPPKN
jgi:glucokinase